MLAYLYLVPNRHRLRVEYGVDGLFIIVPWLCVWERVQRPHLVSNAFVQPNSQHRRQFDYWRDDLLHGQEHGVA